MNNNVAINDRSSDYAFLENNSSQEQQCSRKSLGPESRSTSGRKKKAKKFNREKGVRLKVLGENLHHMLTHNDQKVEIEYHGDSRNSHETMTSGNGKSGHNASFDNMPSDYKEVHAERRTTFSVVEPDEEEQEHNNVAEECDKIEDKESNSQLKSQR